MPDSDPENPGAEARRKHDDVEFVKAMSEHQPASAREIAEAVGCPRRTADYRLRKLRDGGVIKSKKVGPSVVWLLAAEE